MQRPWFRAAPLAVLQSKTRLHRRPSLTHRKDIARMREQLLQWLTRQGYPHTDFIVNLVMIALIVLTTLLLHAVIHYGIFRFIGKKLGKSKLVFLNVLAEQKLFTNLALTIQGILLAVQLRIWLPASEWREGLITVTNI